MQFLDSMRSRTSQRPAGRDSNSISGHRPSRLKIRSPRAILCLASLALLSATAYPQSATIINLGAQSRNPDFSTFPFTRPLSVGNSLPATCQVGQLYFDAAATPGMNIYGCTAVNSWTAESNGGAGTTVWGEITGTLAAQTDLWTVLTGKQNVGNYITALMGDATAAGPGTATLTLNAINASPGTCGDASHVCQITANAKGLVVGETAVPITAGTGTVTHTTGNLTSGQLIVGNGVGDIKSGNLSGDVSTTGTTVTTLATVNTSPGTCGDATHVCQVITNGKGLVTSQSAVAITGAGGSLTIQNNGTSQGTASTINFTSNLTATVNGGVATVAATGAGSGSSSQLTDLGTTFAATSAAIAAGIWGVGNTTYSTTGVTVTINTLTVSGATNSSPITLTLNSTLGLHNGDTINVSGINGNTAANGTWTITVQNGTQIILQGSTGNGTYTSGGVVAGSGNGVAYIEANDSGNIAIYHSSSAGLVITCSGSCVSNQMTSPAFDPDALPIAVLTISNGAFTAALDERSFMRNRGITAGLGISITDAGGSANVAVDTTVARTTGSNTFTGANTFAGGYVLSPAGSQPTCNAANEGWIWYTKGSSSTNGNLQICQNQSGSYLWVTH